MTHPVGIQNQLRTIQTQLRADVSGGAAAGPVSTAAGDTSGVSTIAPSTQPSQDGFCSKLMSCISNFFSGLRSFLASLPLIGRCFGSAQNPDPAADPIPVPPPNPDFAYLDGLKKVFPDGGTTVSPQEDVVKWAVTDIQTLASKLCKVEALRTVLFASNSTPAIAKRIYDVLPAEIKEEFKHAMYEVNCANSGDRRLGSFYNGHDHGMGFGEYMVWNQILSTVAKTAVENMLTAERAAAAALPVPG
jgi:hypothetical protein